MGIESIKYTSSPSFNCCAIFSFNAISIGYNLFLLLLKLLLSIRFWKSLAWPDFNFPKKNFTVNLRRLTGEQQSNNFCITHLGHAGICLKIPLLVYRICKERLVIVIQENLSKSRFKLCIISNDLSEVKFITNVQHFGILCTISFQYPFVYFNRTRRYKLIYFSSSEGIYVTGLHWANLHFACIGNW